MNQSSAFYGQAKTAHRFVLERVLNKGKMVPLSKLFRIRLATFRPIWGDGKWKKDQIKMSSIV